MTAIEERIIKQLEYYFGNWNLPRDKFLQKNLQLFEGWVPIEVLLTFNRLAAITTDPEVVAKAVKESNSEIVSVSEDGKKIRRSSNNPLPERETLSKYLERNRKCIVRMKGFPLDSKFSDIVNFVQRYGQVENVIRHKSSDNKTFLGSILCTYLTPEEAENAQKNEDRYGEIELIKQTFEDYFKTKKAKHRKSRKRKLAIRKEYVKGLVLSVEGFAKGTKIGDMKRFFDKFGHVGYISYDDGSKAEIRFPGEEGSAGKAWGKAVAEGENGKVIFMENEITARVLDGDEEKKYWDAFNSKFHSKMIKMSRQKEEGNAKKGGPSRTKSRKKKLSRREQQRRKDSMNFIKMKGKKRQASPRFVEWSGKRVVFTDDDDQPVPEPEIKQNE